MAAQRHWSDEELLTMLYWLDVQKMPIAVVARKLNRSLGSTSGTRAAIRDKTDAVDLSPHLNGTMPPLWWQAGIEAQKAKA